VADKGSSEPGGEVLDWFISHYDKPPTSQQLSRDQLLITFASIYNLSNALSYLVFDLAAYSECIPELRAELKDVLGEEEVIDKHTLPKLRKLDSFLRESQRLNPPSIGEAAASILFP
jgi:cytochrome P450